METLTMQAEDEFLKDVQPEANPHECPLCNWLCTCSDQPCSCCAEDQPTEQQKAAWAEFEAYMREMETENNFTNTYK